MKRFLIILTLLIVILATGGYFLVKYAITPAELPLSVIDTEEALAAPGTIAIGSVDVTYLRRIKKIMDAGNDPSPLPATHSKPAKSLIDKLKQQGIDLFTSTDYAVATINVAQAEPAYSLVLLGRFSPARLKKAIAQDYLVEEGTGGVLLITKSVAEKNPDPCAKPSTTPPRQQAIKISNNRILLSSPTFMPVLQKRLSSRALAGVSLKNWRAFRKGKAVAAAVIKPVDARKGAVDLPSAMVLGALSQQPLNELYAGAVISLFPQPGFSLLIDAHANKAEWPAQVKAKFDAWKADAGLVLDELPTLNALIKTLNLKAEGTVLKFSTHVNKKTLDNIGKVPGEFMQMAFSGLFGGEKEQPVGEEQVVKASEIEKYQPQFDLTSIAGFDPKSTFYKPDAIAGPVAVRLKKIGLLATDESVIELDVTAEGKGFENLPTEMMHQSDQAPVAGLSITRVEDKEGKNLLREELCGLNRNLAPASLNPTRDKTFENNEWVAKSIKVSGDKSVRLKPFVTLQDIAKIKGNVSVEVATRTRVQTVKLPFTGKTIQTGKVRMYLRKNTPSTVKYTLSGDTKRILAIRAKNAKGQYLAAAGSSAMGNETRMVSKQFKGKVASIEVVVAEEMQRQQYPFEIDSIAPRYGKRGDGKTQVEVKEISKTRFLKNHREMQYKEEDCKGKQKVRLGTFMVCMNKFGSQWGQQTGGEFDVFAPYDEGLQNDLSAGMLSIDSVITDTGKEIKFDKQERVGFDYKFELKYNEKTKEWDVVNRRLRGADVRVYSDNKELKDKKISTVKGTLTIRLPRKTGYFDLGARNLGVVEKSKDGIYADVSAFEDWSTYIDLTGAVDKVMRFLPIANDGKLLNTANERINLKHYSTFALSKEEKAKIDALPEKWEGMITIYGEPKVIRVIYANHFDTIKYKFQFPVVADKETRIEK